MISLQAIQQIPLFSGLCEEYLRHLQPEFKEKPVFPVGASLLCRGEHGSCVYFLQQGFVKVCLDILPSPEGHFDEIDGAEEEERGLILSIVGPGAVLGEINGLDGLGHSAHVIAFTKCRCLAMDSAVFNRHVRETPALLHKVALNMARCMRRNTRHIEVISRHKVRDALAAILLLLVEEHGKMHPMGHKMIDLPLTQADLADMTGHSLRSINKELSVFKKHGLVGSGCRHQILILDENKLDLISKGKMPRENRK